MEDSTRKADPLTLQCPTCAARYVMPPWQEGQKYGCKKCGASLLFGKFALLQELGRGGFGVVYKAFQADLQRVVALKFLHADSEDAAERFLREARIAANLNHPNITPIFEVGRHEGKPYITMQYVDGVTTNRAQLTPREAAAVMRDAAIAVDYAHARDIVHRDIKPHNLMMTAERSGTSPSDTVRRVYVMDFGLARSSKADSSLTAEGQVMGTPAFMAPEQAEGRTCDAKSDVYSLGATLYALATKRAPFEAATPVQILMQVARGDVTPPSKVNPEIEANLESIILKAMALDPAQRYPTAAQLAADLARWLQGEVPDSGRTVHLSATSKPLPAVPSTGKKGGLAIAAAVAIAVAGAGAVLVMRGEAKPPAPPPVVEDFVAVKLESTPSGATVRAEGTSTTWTTPGEIKASQVKGSTLTLTFSKPGYLSTTRSVTVARGSPQLVFAPLEAEAFAPPAPALPKPLLELRAEPAGAKLRIAGREFSLPARLTDADVPAGEHDIEILLEGYRPLRERVSLSTAAPATLSRTLEKAARAPVFLLASTPPGARVLIDDRDVGQTTPCTIYRDMVKGGLAQVELQLEGHESAVRSVPLRAVPHEEKIELAPLAGSFTVSGAQPNAVIRLIAVPPGARNPKLLAQLWSESAEAVEAALGALEAADVPLAVPRLKELSQRPEASIRDKASRLSGAAPAPRPARLEASIAADGLGNAAFPRVPVSQRFVVLATSAQARDFVSEEIQPLHKKETSVRVEMAKLVTVTAEVRPPLGRFDVILDGKQVGRLDASQRSLRIAAGVVVLKFVPPGNDPLLCAFSATKSVGDRFELAGNLYRLCGQAFESDKDILPAVRAYTKALEEKTVPGAERAEIDALPGRIRKLYQDWIDGLERRAFGAEGDRRLAESKDVVNDLPPVYAATDATKQRRGQAAARLAAAHAKARQPYEAAEWLERAAREGLDPGGEVQGAVAAAGRGFPGLDERARETGARLDALRAAAIRKPGFLGVKVGETAKGLRVEAIAKGSPADGPLRFGDLITGVAGADVATAADLQAALALAGAGAEVELRLVRGAEKLTLGPLPAREPEYMKPPPRVGVLQLVSEQYGIYVNLDEGVDVETGEVLEVWSGGALAGELTAFKPVKRDETYKFGGVECRRVKGVFKKGDEVRKPAR